MRPIGNEPSQSVLKQWFRYDRARGVLVWIKTPRNNTRMLGRDAGSPSKNGYWFVSFMGRKYLRSRLTWVLMKGPIPSGKEIDHSDTDNANDRVENLRIATFFQQNGNTKRRRDNKSGFKGVDYHAAHAGKKWRAQIRANGKGRTIGWFDTAEQAHAAYEAEAKAQFGEFARSA